MHEAAAPLRNVQLQHSILSVENTIVQSYEQGDAGLRAYIASLTESQLRTLCTDVVQYRILNSGGSSRFKDRSSGDRCSSSSMGRERTVSSCIFSILLRFDVTRCLVIGTVIDMLASRKLSGQKALHCVSEIHMCLYVVVRSASHGSASSSHCGNASQRQLEQLLTSIADMILRYVDDATNTRPGNNGADRSQGMAHVLELLPTVISAAQHLDSNEAFHHVDDDDGNDNVDDGDDDSNPKKKRNNQRITLQKEERLCTHIINRILDITWPSNLFLSLLGIFVECNNLHCEPQIRQKLVHRVTENAERVEHGDNAGLLKILLQLAEKYGSADYICVIRSVFALMPQDHLLRLNAYFIVELALKHSQVLLKLVLQLIREDMHSVQLSDCEMCCSNVMLLLLSANNEMFKEEVLTTLTSYMQQMLRYDKTIKNSGATRILAMTRRTNSVGSSSTNNIVVKEENVSSGAVQIILEYCCTVETISEQLLQTCCHWCESKTKVLNRLGQDTLVTLFGRSPSSRLSIMELIFNIIAEDPSAKQKLLYLSVLEQIMRKHAFSVFTSDFLPKVQEWISYLPDFSLDVGKRLLNCFLTSPCPLPSQFESFMFNFLRKSLASRVHTNRILAINGFCALLNSIRTIQGTVVIDTDMDTQTEIIQILGPVMNFEISLRRELYSALYYSLRLRDSIIHPRAVLELSRWLLTRARKFIRLQGHDGNTTNVECGQLAQNLYQLNLLSCFEYLGEEFNEDTQEMEPIVCERESIAELLMSLFALYDSAMHQICKGNGTGSSGEHSNCELEALRTEMDNIRFLYHSLATQLTSKMEQLLMILGMTKSVAEVTYRMNNGNKGKSRMPFRSESHFIDIQSTLLSAPRRIRFILPIYEALIQHSCSKHFALERSKRISLLEMHALLFRMENQRRKYKVTIDQSHVSLDTAVNLFTQQLNVMDNVRTRIEQQSLLDIGIVDDEGYQNAEDTAACDSDTTLSLMDLSLISVVQNLCLLEWHITTNHETMHVIREKIMHSSQQILGSIATGMPLEEDVKQCKEFAEMMRTAYSLFHMLSGVVNVRNSDPSYKRYKVLLSRSKLVTEVQEHLSNNLEFAPFFRNEVQYSTLIEEARLKLLLLLRDGFEILEVFHTSNDVQDPEDQDGNVGRQCTDLTSYNRLLFNITDSGNGLITPDEPLEYEQQHDLVTNDRLIYHYASMLKNELDSERGCTIRCVTGYTRLLFILASHNTLTFHSDSNTMASKVINILRGLLQQHHATAHPNFTREVLSFILTFAHIRDALSFASEICSMCATHAHKVMGSRSAGQHITGSMEEVDDDNNGSEDMEWQNYCGTSSCFNVTMQCILTALEQALFETGSARSANLQLLFTGNQLQIEVHGDNQDSPAQPQSYYMSKREILTLVIECLNMIVGHLLSFVFTFATLKTKFELLITKLCRQVTNSVKHFAKNLSRTYKKHKVEMNNNLLYDEDEPFDEEMEIMLLMLRKQAPIYRDIAVMMSLVVRKNGAILSSANEHRRANRSALRTLSSRYEQFVFACQRLVTEIKSLNSTFATIRKEYDEVIMPIHALSEAASVTIEWLTDDHDLTGNKRRINDITAEWSSESRGRRSKRGRSSLRSRNMYIDRELQFTDGTDTFADLEDFIDDNDLRVMEQMYNENDTSDDEEDRLFGASDSDDAIEEEEQGYEE